jgi:hypothetical protein
MLICMACGNAISSGGTIWEDPNGTLHNDFLEQTTYCGNCGVFEEAMCEGKPSADFARIFIADEDESEEDEDESEEDEDEWEEDEDEWEEDEDEWEEDEDDSDEDEDYEREGDLPQRTKLSLLHTATASATANHSTSEDAIMVSEGTPVASQPIHVAAAVPEWLADRGDGTWTFTFRSNAAPTADWIAAWERRRSGASGTKFIAEYLELHCRPEELDPEFARPGLSRCYERLRRSASNRAVETWGFLGS